VPITVLGRYPCRLVSVSYEIAVPFHGDNTGSNPVGDANKTKELAEVSPSIRGCKRDTVWWPFCTLFSAEKLYELQD